MQVKVILKIELVESLIDQESIFTGSVLLLEIKEAMETSISAGLLNGDLVSLRFAFDEAWVELVEIEPPIDMAYSSD